MRKVKFQEKGQALIVIALAAIILFGFTALAIDGSRAYSDRRQAQNSADAAALAGALAYSRDKTNSNSVIVTASQARAITDGYGNNGTSTVNVTIADLPLGGDCPGGALGKDITVEIYSTISTSISQVIGKSQLTNRVSATARGCGYIVAPLFGGNAIVSLAQTNNPCAFDSGQSNAAHWKIQGGGIFSNGCADEKNGNSVTLDPGECVTAVGTASNNFPCTQHGSTKGYQNAMPPNPCLPGGVGLPQGTGSTFSNGVYCITDLDALDKKDITLNNATLYVTDPVFNLKFAGGGGFNGTASTSGDYANFYMIVAPTSPACPTFTSQSSQVIVFRGNGSGTFSGTILAPTACIDLRGNGESSGIHTQIVANYVTSNGNAEVYVNYKEEENHQTPYNPTITLLR